MVLRQNNQSFSRVKVISNFKATRGVKTSTIKMNIGANINGARKMTSSIYAWKFLVC